MDRKKHLSGWEKELKRKKIKAQEERDSKIASRFFKASSVNEANLGDASSATSTSTELSTNEFCESEVDSGVFVKNASDSQLTPSSTSSSIQITPDISDPSTWEFPLTDLTRQNLLECPPKQQLLPEYPRVGKCSFNPKHFQCSKDKKAREWLLYSKTTNSLFCFSCCLFSSSTRTSSTFSNFGNGRTGFNDFVHQSRGITEHEKTDNHFQSTIKWKEYQHQKSQGRLIDSDLQKQLGKEVSFWKDVLHGLLDAVMFLAKNNLAFQGKHNRIGEQGCGNFLSLVELLSKYYAPLAVHLSKIKERSANVTYLSDQIQNEFIDIIGSHIRSKIIHSIQQRKYFSILFDATPDVSNMEQISQVIRTVYVSENECRVEENFLGFIHLDLKTGQDIANAILQKLSEEGLKISDCRGQGYDNGSNMSGKYNGVQAKIKEVCSLATFLPCAAHSLNLVGANTASKVLQGKLLLGQVQNLYTFFAASPYRWNKLKKYVRITVKSQSNTRWSSKHNAIFAATTQYGKILEALADLIDSDETNAHTMTEANALLSQISNFRFLLGLHVWQLILERINKCNIQLQRKNLSVDSASKHLKGLLDWFSEFQTEGFERAYELASICAKKNDIDENSGFDIRISRGRKPARFRETEDETEVNLNPVEKFKLEFFNQVVEHMKKEYGNRFELLQLSNNLFGFLWGEKLASLSVADMAGHARNLFSIYKDDLNEEVFIKESTYLRSAITPFLKQGRLEDTSCMEILTVLWRNGLEEQFSNVSTSLRIFLTLPVTVASNERSFSKLKLIKNYLRSTMGENRLSDLSIISIEHERAANLCFDELIHDFASRKCRKVQI